MKTATTAPASSFHEETCGLLDRHSRHIFTLIYRIVGNEADAQDLTQETCMKALQSRGQLRDELKTQAWIGAIARNTALDFLRRNSRIRFCEVETLDLSHDDNPERMFLRAESRERLDQGLQRLTWRERTALLLRDVELLDADEVARELGCSKATVRCHIANARVKFRRFLLQNHGYRKSPGRTTRAA